jgi:uncharacterized cysteine cluster protein YcgN (CxxCxxCC family)
MTPRFWEDKPLAELDPAEWEALCDGCGKCCLHKLEDADTLELHFTNVACRLLDRDACRCSDYPSRTNHVPDCMVLSASELDRIDWLPATCAYRLRADGRPLPEWHPLVSGDPDSVHRAGQSVRGWCVSEEAAGDLWGHLVPADRIHDGA